MAYNGSMATPILATKLYIPPPRPKIVFRPRLFERLSEGLATGRKLTLISAPAGFGKTTLVSEWVATCGRPVVWLSLVALARLAEDIPGEKSRLQSYLRKAFHYKFPQGIYRLKRQLT
jgi:ATP/maltotriose-dependent transcriptional regulator MalT